MRTFVEAKQSVQLMNLPSAPYPIAASPPQNGQGLSGGVVSFGIVLTFKMFVD
jgi:hypothetical protein